MERWQPAAVDEVLAVLEAGDDQRLVGVYEASWLDFKGTYHFGSKRERWEFGKDVAALANSGGGMTLVGVQTEVDPSRDEEFASEVVPVPHGAFDVTRALHCLDEDVYPPVEGVQIRVFLRSDDETKRLVAVVVPKQPRDLEPFLLTKTVDEEKQSWRSFAVPRRSGSHTVFQKVGLIHRDIADGRRRRDAASSATVPPEEVTDRDDGPLEAVEAREAEPLLPHVRYADDPSVFVPPAEQWTHGSIDFLDKALGVTDIPMLYLTAVPSGQRRRPVDFFAQAGFRTALSQKSTLRSSGFGLTYGHNVQVGARSLMSVDEDRTVLRVDTDGHAVNGACGTSDHLGWSYRPGDARIGRPAQRINVVALNEFVFEFCRFVERELAPRWGANGWTLVVAARRAQSAEVPLVLPDGYSNGVGWMYFAHPAETDERIEGFLAELEPERDAAVLLEAIYGVFGLGLDADPFVADGRFSVEKLTQL